MRFLVATFLFLAFFQLTAQVDATIGLFNLKDSTKSDNIYYSDLTDKLLIKFTNNVKSTGLNITNKNTERTVKLAPAGGLDLGFGFNYKWLGLGFTLGLPSGAGPDSTKGKTTKFDLQLNIYSKRVVVDALYQRYKGFHVQNPGDFANWDSTTIFPQLPDMENYSLGVSAYYILNHKKFSYRAAYVRNEIQNKSAGSLLAGPFFNADAATTDNGFIPKNLPIEVQDTFDISRFSSISYGLAFGYTYSVVIKKKFFMNFSLVPGVGVKNLKTSLKGVDRASKTGVAARVTYRFAMGYEHRWFLLGLTVYGTQGNIEIDNYQFKPGAGILKLFVAKRFDLKKKKKFTPE